MENFDGVDVACGGLRGKAEIRRTEHGVFQVEKQKFGVAYWSLDWKVSAGQVLNPESVSFPGEGGDETPQGIRRHGVWRISADRQFQYVETVRTLSPNENDLQLDLKSDPGIPTSILAWCTRIPDAEYSAAPAVFNGKVLPPPAKQQEFESDRENELILNLRKGRLMIRGRFSLTLLPSSGGIEIRLRFPKSWGKIHAAQLKLHLRYEPYVSRTIDLRSAANMGFQDENADDRIGGWTDQGADNDLRAMVPGVREFAGVSFDIIDPGKNRGKSLSGDARRSAPLLSGTRKGQSAGMFRKLPFPSERACLGSGEGKTLRKSDRSLFGRVPDGIGAEMRNPYRKFLGGVRSSGSACCLEEQKRFLGDRALRDSDCAGSEEEGHRTGVLFAGSGLDDSGGDGDQPRAGKQDLRSRCHPSRPGLDSAECRISDSPRKRGRSLLSAGRTRWKIRFRENGRRSFCI